MKKSSFLVVVISVVLVTGFLCIGCASFPYKSADIGVYGSGVSEEQLCTLEIAGGLKVVGFNGNAVAWGNNGSDRSENKESGGKDWEAMMDGNDYKTIIKIPAGSHSLVANLFLWNYNNFPGWNPRNGFIRANGLKINYDFQPGHTYFLRPVMTDKPLVGDEETERNVYTGSTYVNSNSVFKRQIRSVKLRIDEGTTVVAEGTVISFK